MKFAKYIQLDSPATALEEYDDQELSDYASDAFDDDNTSINEVDQAIAAMESLSDIYSKAEKTGKTDASDSIYANYAFESIAQITGVDMSVTRAALESCNFTDNKTLAQEAVRDSSASTVSAVAEWLTRRFKNNVDGMQALVLLFQRQSAQAESLRRKLGGMNIGKNGTTHAKITKYLRHNNGELVKDFPEYLKLFTQMSEFMQVFNRKVQDFSSNDFTQSVKVLVSPLTGYDEKYEELFENLSDFVKTIAKLPAMKKVYSGEKYEDWDSPVFIGMSHVEVRIPEPGSYTEGRLRQMRGVHKHFACELVRDHKFGMGGGRHDLTGVDQRGLESLLKECESLIDSYDGMLNIFQKLSSILGSQWVLHDAMTKIPFPIQWWVAFMSNYRLLVRSSAVLFACASGAQNFSRGNIHTALSLVENAR